MANAVWKWKQYGELLLICSSEGQLVDADFDPCLELHRANKVLKALTWAPDNVSMTAVQRKKAGEAMGDHPAVTVTDSTVTRGIITAFSWLGKPWRAFRSSELRAAIKSVGVPAGITEEQIFDALHALKAEVDKELQTRAAAG